MGTSGPPEDGSSGRRARGLRVAGWRLLQALTLAGLGYVIWSLFGHHAYRIDIDVYRMGGRAWLDGRPLYAGNAMFHTEGGLDLPFTYPPLAAVMFAPFGWLSLPAASAAITCTTLALLVVSMAIVLDGLAFWPRSAGAPGPAWWRRGWVAAAIVVVGVMCLEPIQSNFSFGQINVVLMTLVLADCVPRRTPWPRGLLLGLAIALKLTPAVFLLYFLLRRDGRAILTASLSFLVATVIGFALAWRDSWQYWTGTLHNTERIGDATLNTNQNLAGVLARLPLDDRERMTLWAVASVLVLAITVWAGRRALAGDEAISALICVAVFGLAVSPVSWSHHWVWMLPAVVVAGLSGYRRRAWALTGMGVAGVALMVWSPIKLLPEHHEADASWWRQLLGASYLWWALALIVVIGVTFGPNRRPGSTRSDPVVTPATTG